MKRKRSLSAEETQSEDLSDGEEISSKEEVVDDGGECSDEGLGDEGDYSHEESIGDEEVSSDEDFSNEEDLEDEGSFVNEQHCSDEEDHGDEEFPMSYKAQCCHPLPPFATDEPVIADLGFCHYCTRMLEKSQLTSWHVTLHPDYIGHLKQRPSLDCMCCVLISLGLRRKVNKDADHNNDFFLSWGSEFRVIIPAMSRPDPRGVITIDRVWERRPKDIGDLIDFQAVSGWLDDCRTKHTTKCQMARSSRHSMRLNVLLVDVLQNCLVEQETNCPYVVLSYVWGGVSMFKTMEGNVIALQQPGALSLVKLPLTVSDAMLMTKLLNQRYLWVDCLSVIQDSKQKQHMIDNMDIIYAQAIITIVAATNEHADEGLPGVRLGSRTPILTSLNVNHHQIDLHLPTSGKSLLLNTVYNSRGWTFQELLLSNRLLFVEEHQLVFHCQSSWRSESMPFEQTAQWGIDRLEHYRSADYGFDHIDLDVSRPRCSRDLIEMNTRLINGYSRRHLTVQDDKLDAFSGIATILKELSGGKPVLYGMMTTVFVESLMWTFEHCEVREPTNAVCRLSSFPSWSWMGWRARVCSLSTDLASAYRCSFLSNVRILDQSGRIDASDSMATVPDQNATDSRTWRPSQLNIEIVPTASPASLSADSPFSVLACNAQRSDWVEFSIEQPYAALGIFAFRPRNKRENAGYLAIPPNYEMHSSNSLSSPSGESYSASDLSLVRMAGVALENQEAFDHLQWGFRIARSLALGAQLAQLEKESKRDEEAGADEFAQIEISPDWIGEADDVTNALLARLTQVPLLFVMLVRRHGFYWERVGSGLIRADCWPEAHEGAEPRSYEEEIRII